MTTPLTDSEISPEAMEAAEEIEDAVEEVLDRFGVTAKRPAKDRLSLAIYAEIIQSAINRSWKARTAN